MKPIPFILILLCFGCRALDRKIVHMSATSQVQPQSAAASIAIASPTVTVTWQGTPGSAAYAFCYGSESRGYSSVVRTETTNCQANLTSGNTYYCAVMDVDSNNLGSDFSAETVITMPLVFDLAFPSQLSATNPQLQSSRDLLNWSPRESAFANGIWRVSASNGVPQEFYRLLIAPNPDGSGSTIN